MYYGALCKIKANKNFAIDPLYKKRIVTIQFGCNKRISSAKFKGTLDNYGYDVKGRAALKTALLRKNHLFKDPIVVITINIRHACKCTQRQINSHEYDSECEIHSQKKKPIPLKTKKTLHYYFKS